MNNIISMSYDKDAFAISLLRIFKIQFAKDIYQRDKSDEYTIGKFKGMQSYFINWVANLDGNNRQRLADAINNSHPTIERHFREGVGVLNLNEEEK